MESGRTREKLVYVQLSLVLQLFKFRSVILVSTPVSTFRMAIECRKVQSPVTHAQTSQTQLGFSVLSASHHTPPPDSPKLDRGSSCALLH